jgi:hypothetical protein
VVDERDGDRGHSEGADEEERITTLAKRADG